MLKQTQPRALPLSPAPLPSSGPAPDGSHLLRAAGESQHFRTEARGESLSARPHRPGPEKPAAPRFPCGVPRCPPGRTPPLILEDARCAARRDSGPGTRQGPADAAGRDTVGPSHPGHAPSLSAPERPARSPGFASAAAVLFPTRTRGPQSRSS